MKATRAAAFYAAASVAAGGLHYLFQLWAVTQLNSKEFGELTSWIAYFSITLTLGAFAQYGANFFPASAKTLKRLSWGAIVLAALSMTSPYVLGTGGGGVKVAIIGVALGVMFSWFSGQAQAQLAFVVMGVGIFLTGITKFFFAGASFPVQQASIELAWAVALCYSPALIWMAMAMILFADKWTPTSARRRNLARGLGATAILSFSSVFIPQMDIVAVHNTQTAELVGEFSRISLLYKAVFFGFLIFAQWLLPHQLGHQTTSYQFVKWIGQSRWRVLLTSAAMGALTFICSLTLGVALNPALKDQILWIFLSCVNMVFLTNLFFAIQISCVQEVLLRPFLISLFLICELLLSMVLQQPITQYLETVIVLNFIAWLVLVRNPQPQMSPT